MLRADDASGKSEVRRCVACGVPLIRVPLLECADCGTVHPLRALHYKSGPIYVAECIDLNLITEGQTPEEAIAHLQEAMEGYLTVAFEGDTSGLVLRPSPLGHRLRYHWHSLRQRIRRSRHSTPMQFVPGREPDGHLQHCP
jgi:predicted RNase H-like HicB family nuclease